MKKHIKSLTILVLLFSAAASGDIFRKRNSDEIFYGYCTQKTSRDKTRIYVYENEKFIGRTVKLNDYNIEYSPLGRKNNAIIVEITHPDMILSSAVSKLISKTIVEASNKGPLLILLEIDSPGGRGDYMKNICDTIEKTTNCPVVAFITGTEHGGAHSAAAAVALACDKIYITPQATISSSSPSMISSETEENVYAPDNIASYGTFVKNLADKKNRPGEIAAAMVDKYIEIVEVIVDQKGTRKFVDKANKKPSDVIVRTISKKLNPVFSNTTLNTSIDSQQSNVFQTSLTAKDAVYAKIADSIVVSRAEVLADLGAEHAKVIPTVRIKKSAATFTKNRTAVGNIKSGISELERQVEEIENQIKQVSEAGQKNQEKRLLQKTNKVENNYYYSNTKTRWESKKNVSPNRKAKNKNRQAHNNTGSELYVDPYLVEYQRLHGELAYVLDQMIGKYNAIIKIGKKYPGALPTGENIRSIEQQRNLIMIKRRSSLLG